MLCSGARTLIGWGKNNQCQLLARGMQNLRWVTASPHWIDWRSGKSSWCSQVRTNQEARERWIQDPKKEYLLQHPQNMSPPSFRTHWKSNIGVSMFLGIWSATPQSFNQSGVFFFTPFSHFSAFILFSLPFPLKIPHHPKSCSPTFPRVQENTQDACILVLPRQDPHMPLPWVSSLEAEPETSILMDNDWLGEGLQVGNETGRMRQRKGLSKCVMSAGVWLQPEPTENCGTQNPP